MLNVKHALPTVIVKMAGAWAYLHIDLGVGPIVVDAFRRTQLLGRLSSMVRLSVSTLLKGKQTGHSSMLSDHCLFLF
eukprot:scaffold466576_cov49-Prasinocladus_malaysianus.AAC.3